MNSNGHDSRLGVFALFHLNLAYSSIEEERRPLVVKRSYWPLLKLIRDRNLPLGIEATVYTLEAIESFDPAWIAELKTLYAAGKCEVIASGYAQIIGPLVPAQVTAANLRLGNLGYERLLGRQPSLALINEQAYSAGLLQLYRDAGFEAIIMEWDNPASAHPEWNPEWQYLPQIACGQHGEEMPLIWNQSVAFQKFQRYAHGEMELDEYLAYLRGHVAGRPRTFSVYGNDAEVFDFRPGRFHTEAPLSETSEWQRIEQFFRALQNDPEFHVISPRAVLQFAGRPGAANHLHLESANQPVPVKKQSKYNITRWAVTGRDDLGVNTSCWRIYEALRQNPAATDQDWRELCHLWSSDFRTHITDKRWTAFRARLAEAEKKYCAGAANSPEQSAAFSPAKTLPPEIKVRREKNFLEIETPAVKIRLNSRRGLAIDKLALPAAGDDWLCGTLPHGFFSEVDWAADYYSGHLVFEIPGKSKVTDLERVDPEISWNDERGLRVSATLQNSLGVIHKQLVISRREPKISLEYRVRWNQSTLGSLRLGQVTLNPAAFEKQSLFCRTHNGGFRPTTFQLADAPVDHGAPVSFLVSARQAMGVTGGIVQIGDARRALQIEVDKTQAAVVGMLTCKNVRPAYFLRLAFSGQELDETSRAGQGVFSADGGERVFRMSWSLVTNKSSPAENSLGAVEAKTLPHAAS